MRSMMDSSLAEEYQYFGLDLENSMPTIWVIEETMASFLEDCSPEVDNLS